MRAVIFDLGGVVLDSPLHVIGEYEREEGIEQGSINRAVSSGGATSAWARHERGELTRSTFLDVFGAELQQHGLHVRTGELMTRIESSFRVRPRMVGAIERLRAEGYAVAALTNNWSPFPEDGLPRHFDVFVESVTEGVRKPEREIYLRCLQRIGVDAGETVMLDDLGPNLKTALALGMATIKVSSVDQALADLGPIVGLEF